MGGFLPALTLLFALPALILLNLCLKIAKARDSPSWETVCAPKAQLDLQYSVVDSMLTFPANISSWLHQNCGKRERGLCFFVVLCKMCVHVCHETSAAAAETHSIERLPAFCFAFRSLVVTCSR